MDIKEADNGASELMVSDTSVLEIVISDIRGSDMEVAYQAIDKAATWARIRGNRISWYLISGYPISVYSISDANVSGIRVSVIGDPISG